MAAASSPALEAGTHAPIRNWQHDGGDDLAATQLRDTGANEELVDGQLPLAVRSSYHEARVVNEQRRRRIGRG